MPHIVVIGAGQAGASLVGRLRNKGYEGDITLIGAEPQPPYQRPPLSKAYLTGEMELERLFLRPERFYAEQSIQLRTGLEVRAIDRANKTLDLGDETISYDTLALTTGSSPRHLPSAIGGDLKGIYAVRTLADADAMAQEFTLGRHALIVGGGYIGLEAAAVAAKRGVRVTVLEMADRILQRVASPETSDYFRVLHQRHGVDIREGVGLSKLLGEGRVAGAVLSDGSHLDVDFVIAGIGIVPETGLAEAAGLEIENGIKVDALCRTSDPDIYAAGDCASFPYKNSRLRLESVPNAIDQGEAAADVIMGGSEPYVAKPWFWSDQYDVKLQIAGLNTGYDRVVTRDGDGPVSYWYYKGNQLLAVDAMNDPLSYMMGKRWIEAGKSPAPDDVGNVGLELKSLAV